MNIRLHGLQRECVRAIAALKQAPDVEIVHPHPDGPQPEAQPEATEAKTPPPVAKPSKPSKR